MDHAPGDRPGPYDADFDRQIIEVLWLKPWQHRHLCPAFDLKDPDSIAFAHHVEDPRIFGRNRCHGVFQAPILLQKLKTKVKLP
jgi:hypothetical protein